jgi:WD40 repeat protein
MSCCKHFIAFVALLLFAKPVRAELPRLHVDLDGIATCVAWSPGGELLAVGLEDGRIQILDALTGKRRQTFEMMAEVKAIAFSSNGENVAATGAGWFGYWSLDSAIPKHSLRRNRDTTEVIAITASGANTCGVAPGMTWSTFPIKLNGTETYAFNEYAITTGRAMRSAAISSDGSVSGWLEGDRWIMLSFGEGKRFISRYVPSRTDRLRCLALGKRGTIAVSGSSKTVEVWTHCDLTDEKTAAKPVSLEGMDRFPSSLVFSADGCTLAAVGDDSTVVHSWNLDTQPTYRRLVTSRGPLGLVQLAPDGMKFAAAFGRRQSVAIWDTAPTPVGRAQIPVELTEKELAGYWDRMGSGDREEAIRAWIKLAEAKCPVSFLREHIRNVWPTRERRLDIERGVADLDSGSYPVREKAAKDLLALGEAALPALERTLEERPSLELATRARRLLAKIQKLPFTSDQVRALDAIELLERGDSPDAISALKGIERETIIPSIRDAAQAALERHAVAAGGKK